MSAKALPFLLTLPLEMLHRIFDDLDASTILLSVRDVCQQLRTATDTYNMYALDFTTTSQSDFHRLLNVVRPECVTALTLSDRELTSGRIAAFLSLADLYRFTRLRSLILLEINKRDLLPFLEHASRCSLTSLTVQTRSDSFPYQQQTIQHLSSIIGQPTLLRLELRDRTLCRLIDQMKRPAKCKLRYLTMECSSVGQGFQILEYATDLEGLVLDETFRRNPRCGFHEEDFLIRLSPRLTSLTLCDCSLSMNAVESLLSQTPSLRHLKLTSYEDFVIDGSRWEQLIKTKLPALNNFEFYMDLYLSRLVDDTPKLVIDEIIAPFRSPFWIEEKRWLVTCSWSYTRETGEMYTSPICISKYTHLADSNTTTLSNYDLDAQHPMILKNVQQLCLGNFCAERVSRIDHFSFESLAKVSRRDLLVV